MSEFSLISFLDNIREILAFSGKTSLTSNEMDL